MSCSRMEKQMMPYVDGRLKIGEQREVEAHLAACPARQPVGEPVALFPKSGRQAGRNARWLGAILRRGCALGRRLMGSAFF